MLDLAPPAALDYAKATITRRDTLAETRSVYSGAEARLDFGGEWWEMTLVTPYLDWDDAAELEAWCDRLRDDDARAVLPAPSPALRRGTTTANTVAVTVAASAGDRSVTVGGLGAGATLLAGSFVQTEGLRLHRIRQDVTANGDGVGVLELFPRLRGALAVDDTLRLAGTERPRGLWRLIEAPPLAWDAERPGLAEPMTLTFVEAVA